MKDIKSSKGKHTISKKMTMVKSSSARDTERAHRAIRNYSK